MNMSLSESGKESPLLAETTAGSCASSSLGMYFARVAASTSHLPETGVNLSDSSAVTDSATLFS